MNIDYTEVPYTVIAKMCSYGRSTRKVTILIKRLLKYATEEIDKQTIEKEISGLKMTLDLIS